MLQMLFLSLSDYIKVSRVCFMYLPTWKGELSKIYLANCYDQYCTLE